ncbi:hypothetical protein CFIO01_02728 [Colletotrichum fioriniae PJ7]|uniref:Uncharacterized protein n=1 Tax=Colletotrichum fioriniae PJ7 TaxID=1445577 RepID=A0A010SI14_9PEZI|nr:hypothetical protein CFIO01_02728 [Colletotrichum fioriniae PJ7]
MDPSHVTLDLEVLERLVARIVAEVAESRPAQIVGENGWTLVRRDRGVWMVIETDHSGNSRYIGNEERITLVGHVERRDANQSNGQHDEDVEMTDAPPIESGEGVDVHYISEEIELLIRRLEQLRIAPHRTFSVENTQVGETSEDVKMANSAAISPRCLSLPNAIPTPRSPPKLTIRRPPAPASDPLVTDPATPRPQSTATPPAGPHREKSAFKPGKLFAEFSLLCKTNLFQRQPRKTRLLSFMNSNLASPPIKQFHLELLPRPVGPNGKASDYDPLLPSYRELRDSCNQEILGSTPRLVNIFCSSGFPQHIFSPSPWP